MKFQKTSIILFIISIIFSSMAKTQNLPERFVLIETDLGNMKVKLYNETPKHRDNFLKLVEEGFYDSLMFHRVIQDFMIQGGDPESKNAKPGQALGNGGPGYTIDAEFNSKFFHKKGALAAARQGDNVNPEKKSSGSQFYIVQGQKIDSAMLGQFHQQELQKKQGEIVREYISKPENTALRTRIDSLQRSGDRNGLNQVWMELLQTLDSEMKEIKLESFSEEQKKAYTEIGGTPHLDGGYTVFGEVVEGLEVIDKIAAVKTIASDRPAEDIRMKITIVK